MFKTEGFINPEGFKTINSNNELSIFDIIKIIDDMKLSHVFGGVYSKDQLPSLERNKFYSINLQDSDAGNGTHWTVFFYYKPLTSIFYDSFAFIAPLEVQGKITPYIYNAAAMVIDTVNNIGIGTTAPTSGYKLDVRGNVMGNGSIALNNSIFWSGSTNRDLSRANIAGQYSTSAAINDSVLRTTNKLLLPGPKPLEQKAFLEPSCLLR
jgi:hypothetical protein